MAWDDGASGPRPAVLVSHAWGGRDDFSCQRAEDLAALGYVGFALDVYGKGVHGGTVGENQALMNPLLGDRALLRRRLAAALTCIREQPEVDPGRVAAIGYCFGGLCVLDMARSGADLRGVVSFHGLLSAPEGMANDRISSKVLVLHGHDDPMVPPDQVLAFEQEMTAAGADWQLHAYGHTQHSFTNPEANNPDLGAAYQPDAARRSWVSMQAFLEEVLT
ncbi:MAG: dienelactone hydrolase family protein [Gammaproteobacteria bacterium]|nr:dienelactone hydrolase family protein [Gammaproteobacteria bacterium]